MAEAHVVGSSWDQVMTSILGDNKYVDVNRYVFEHELTTMDTLLNKSPGLMFVASTMLFILWPMTN